MLHWGCGHRCWSIDNRVRDILWHVNVDVSTMRCLASAKNNHGRGHKGKKERKSEGKPQKDDAEARWDCKFDSLHEALQCVHQK